MEEKTIKSLEHFVELIIKNKNDDLFSYIYRGQRKDWKLLPKILRNEYIENEELKDAEKYIFTEFKRKAIAHLDFIPNNNLEWLAIAQHFGLETRLLDWTENALTALWFCINIPMEKGHGAVYELQIFNSIYDYVNEKELKNPFNINETKIYKPSFVNKRIINQTSVFTVHSIDSYIEDTIAISDNSRFADYMTKYKIPYNLFEQFKKDLNTCGINSETIFPDLNGLCSNINEFLRNKGELKRILERVKKYMSFKKDKLSSRTD